MHEFGTIVASAQERATETGDVIQEALATVRQHLGMEIAYFSEFVDGRSVFRRVDAPGLEQLVKVGDSHSLDDVYCNHILKGRLPQLIPDTSREPLAASMPITSAVPIGSHVSIPIHRPDGRPYGMFCCLSPKTSPSLNERDLGVMRIFAGLATKQLHGEIERSTSHRHKRLAVETIIEKSEFDIAFQPIFDLKAMELVSMEALCRFRTTPYRSPDQWFEDAAAVGLGIELELAALRTAADYIERLPDDVSLSLNASPEAILGGALHDVLDSRHLQRLVLEVTEHAQVADYDALHRALEPLRRSGLRIAVDDAGAGYSGLQHIVQIRPDIIKMDMSLTRGIDGDAARRALASAMIFYARETGALIVAEGIETESELRTLRLLGVARGQGYLLGRPAPLATGCGAAVPAALSA